tara:strand:- start:1801 stop:2529 length:729 start_codon:yes stop_codon:yes gene_type:complete
LNRTKKFINQLSIDCVIFGYDDNQLKVLVPKLALKDGYWTLPGGFILQEESIDQAAKRILKERTGINNIFLEQYHVFGEVSRTNLTLMNAIRAQGGDKFSSNNFHGHTLEWLTQRFISIGYYALVDINKVIPKLMSIDESIYWYDINDLPQMIMDHRKQVSKALDALRLNLDNKLLGFNLLPEKFTMKELQKLYEAVYDKPFRRNNFQKKMLDLDVLERLEKKFTGAANKAPYLYRFKFDIN